MPISKLREVFGAVVNVDPVSKEAGAYCGADGYVVIYDPLAELSGSQANPLATALLLEEAEAGQFEERMIFGYAVVMPRTLLVN